MSRIQGEKRPRLAMGMGFTAGRPTQDPVSGEALQTSTVDIVMAPEGSVAGHEILAGVVARFRGEVVPRCEAQHPASGTWSAQVTVDATTRAIRFDAGGTLANHPVGACLAAGLKVIADATTVSANVLPSLTRVQVDLPST